MDLAVEILAAALETRVALGHASERFERLRRPADARRAADERCDALDVHLGRGALGEILAKRVVQPVDSGVRGPPCAGGDFSVSSFDHLLRGCDDVVRGPRIRGGEVFAQERARAARPKEETDAEADREADRDVLDADQPHPPADRLDDVEEHEEDDREARLARGKRDRARRVGGEQDRDGQHAPQHRLVRADADHEQRADDEPDRGPRERVENGRAGAERVRPQHGKRSEHDPERVLKAGPLGDKDGDREPGGAANAVLEPHRADVGVLDGELLRRFEGRMRRRRLRKVVVAELRRTRSGREQCIAGDLAGGVGCRTDSKRRLEHVAQCVVTDAGRELGQPPHECARDGVSRCVEPREIGKLVTTLESLRARPEDGGRRRRCLRVLRADELEARRLGRRREHGEEPVQLAGERGERRRRPGGTGRAMLGAEEAPAEAVDRLACEGAALAELVAVGLDQVRDGSQRAGGRALKVGAPPGRPEQHDRADPRARREAPAFETVRDRGVRRRNRHRQDEGEDRSGRARGEVAVDHAREEHGKADDCHRARGEPRVPRAKGAERDEHGADKPEPEIRGEATPRRAREVGQDEYRERSESREDRRLRLLDHLVREREDRRDDDRGARGALQRSEVRHGRR